MCAPELRTRTVVLDHSYPDTPPRLCQEATVLDTISRPTITRDLWVVNFALLSAISRH